MTYPGMTEEEVRELEPSATIVTITLEDVIITPYFNQKKYEEHKLKQLKDDRRNK